MVDNLIDESWLKKELVKWKITLKKLTRTKVRDKDVVTERIFMRNRIE